MRFKATTIIFLAVSAAFFGLASNASASATAVLLDCNDNGVLDDRYSVGAMRGALKEIPSDLVEYSDCNALINASLLEAAQKKRKRNGNKPGAAATPITPRQAKRVERSLTKLRRKAQAPQKTTVGGAVVSRGQGKTLQSTAGPSVPGGLMITVIGIILLALLSISGRFKAGPGLNDEHDPDATVISDGPSAV